MRYVLLLTVFSVSAFADDVLVRAEAAKVTARKRGPIPVPDEASNERCFVPKFLEGAKCAEGFKLCRDGEGVGSCDGYGRMTVTLRPEFDGEPEPTGFGVNGARPGLPYSHEEGPSSEVEAAMECSSMGAGYGVISRVGETPEEAAARREAAHRQFVDSEQKRIARCEAEVKKRVARERKWQRCELLTVDACRGEAFLQCTGNTKERGLLRASWTRPKDRPASETLKVQVLRR